MRVSPSGCEDLVAGPLVEWWTGGGLSAFQLFTRSL